MTQQARYIQPKVKVNETRTWGIEIECIVPTHTAQYLSLIHISEPTRLLSISYAVFCLKKKNTLTKQ